MAKTEDVKTEDVKTEDVKTEDVKTETVYNAWQDMRTITLPRGQSQEQQFRFVCVNGRSYQVPKGKAVEVPLPIYQCLMESQAMEEAAFQANKAGQ